MTSRHLLRLLPCLIALSMSHLCAGARTDGSIEGIWQWPDDGAVMEIKAFSETTFTIALLDSPDLTIAPGTEIGRAVSTPRPGTYDATISTRDALRPGSKLKSERCTITFTDQGSLVFTPYRTGIRIDLFRLFPYFWRIRPYRDESRPHDIDGPRRIFPEDHTTLHPVL